MDQLYILIDEIAHLQGLCRNLLKCMLGLLDEHVDEYADTGAAVDEYAQYESEYESSRCEEHVAGVYVSWHADTPELAREACQRQYIDFFVTVACEVDIDI